MKNIFIITTILCQLNFLFAQNIKAVFNSSKTNIKFIGLDFSHAKMVGKEAFKSQNKNQESYFSDWNNLFISETNKYDIKRAFMNREMELDFSIVENLNNKIEFAEMLTDECPKSFSDEKIQNIVNQYNTEEMEAGFGLSFIVHSFNKNQERAYIYIVIFDINTKKVLLSEKMSGDAGGFGFRNYWAKTIYNILGNIRDYQFRRWKKQFEDVKM